MRLLVTGANGFVGKPLCADLLRRGHSVRAASRSAKAEFDGFEQTMVGSMGPETDWSAALSDLEVVIHLAARVHVMKDAAADPLAEFRKVNVAGTLNLARQAAAAGVKRFVFVSSIKVNGEATPLGQPFTADDAPAPLTPMAFPRWRPNKACVIWPRKQAWKWSSSDRPWSMAPG